MRRIILTGANGFIASAIRHYNSDRYEFINVTRKEIDFSKSMIIATTNAIITKAPTAVKSSVISIIPNQNIYTFHTVVIKWTFVCF